MSLDIRVDNWPIVIHMDNYPDVVAVIEKRREAQQMSIASLSDQTLIPYATLYRKLHRRGTFSAAELPALAAALGFDNTSDIFTEAERAA